VIAVRPSNKTLSDGRNAHLILEPSDWWLRQLQSSGFALEPDEPKSYESRPDHSFVGVFRPC
jgi:hypothetical protein